MGFETGISWADSTFNPWIGCTAVSPACDHCYAEQVGKRLGVEWGAKAERRRTSKRNWQQVRLWNARAAQAGKPHRVFCASLADVFDNAVPEEWRDALWVLIQGTPALTWMLLTKRPQNIAKMLPPDWGLGYPNVWLGTTVEDQLEANRRIPRILSVPARLHFLSCEPLLGPVDLQRLDLVGEGTFIDALSGLRYFGPGNAPIGPAVRWVIAGGESGGGARPMLADWARGLRDQCAAASVPFHFKQWGEWAPRPDAAGAPKRVGLVAAGKDLDGQSHAAFPDVG